MKIRYFISVSVPREERDRFYAMVDRMGCLDGWHDPWTPRGYPWLDYTLDLDDPRLENLREYARVHARRWSERREHIYTDAELKRFPLLAFGIERKPLESGGCEYGTTYDVSRACPNCGTGAVQTSALMLALTELPKKGLFCSTCLGQNLVDEDLRAALLDARVSGLELRQARFYRNNEPLPWWQMMAPYVMPGISRRSESLIRDTEPLFSATDPKWGCPVCERDMYALKGNIPLHLVYERGQVAPDDLPDAVQTWECFGRSVLRDDPERGLVQGFAQPLLLVKPKVLEVFRKLKVKKMVFQPVRIIED